jgi:hypothetical protein
MNSLRSQYLAREHRKVSQTMLEDELEEIRQARLTEADVQMQQEDTSFDTTNKSGVRMVWRELGQTIALHLGYDETKVEEKDEPVIRAGPREKMGSRFSELYKRHFVATNVENPASCAGDEIGENNIPNDEGVESNIDVCVLSDSCDGKEEKERSRMEEISAFNTVVRQTEKEIQSACRPVSSMWDFEGKSASEPPSSNQVRTHSPQIFSAAAASVASTSAASFSARAEDDDLVELLTDMDDCNDSSAPDPAVDAEALRAALSQAQAQRCRATAAAAAAAASAAAAAKEQLERTAAVLELAQQSLASPRRGPAAVPPAVEDAPGFSRTPTGESTSAPLSPRRPVPRAAVVRL